MIVKQLGVSGSGGLTTAGCQNEEVESSEQEEKVPLGDVTLFRGVAARANCLGPDRPDMLYASKEVCRETSSPSLSGLEKITRIGEFLAGRPGWYGSTQTKSLRRQSTSMSTTTGAGAGGLESRPAADAPCWVDIV